MSCRVYIGKYDYSGIERGGRKKAETQNGRELLGFAVRDAYGLDSASMMIELGEHGKPYFPDSAVNFNISHSGDYAAAAVCSVPVGVDIQVYRPIKEGLVRKLCRGSELDYIAASGDTQRTFINLWSLKESYIKAIGMGMAFPMDEITFDIRGFDGRLTGRFSNREGLYCLCDYGSFSLAVCCLK